MEKERTNTQLPPCINVEKCKECLFRTLCLDDEDLELIKQQWKQQQALRGCNV